jgi:hypothetical protein
MGKRYYPSRTTRVARSRVRRAIAQARSVVFSVELRRKALYLEICAAKNRIRDLKPWSRERIAAKATLKRLRAEDKAARADMARARLAVKKALAAAREQRENEKFEI